MSFLPSIASRVDGTALYMDMAWLVVDIFLPLLMLLLLFNLLLLPTAYLHHYQHTPHLHLNGLIIIVNDKDSYTTTNAVAEAHNMSNTDPLLRQMPRHLLPHQPQSLFIFPPSVPPPLHSIVTFHHC
jgi:hypothetical protein